MVNKLNIEFYNTVLAQTFTPCGNYLVTGDIYGNLSVFNLTKLVDPQENLNQEARLPKHKITVHADIQINSLLTTQDHLLVGGYGEIFAYSWKTIKGLSTNTQPVWSIKLPSTHENLEKAEVNSLVMDEDLGKLYTGCGDNKIYIYDLESRSTLAVLINHSEYVHCLRKHVNNSLLSGGQDGLLNIWDLRLNKVIEKIEPHLNNQINRNKLGKWIGAVDSNEDYIVCGGGPRLALYHTRFLRNCTIFPFDDKGIHVADISDDKIFAGGRSKLFYQADFNGDIVSEIQTCGPAVFSMVKQEKPFQIMCIAGSSPKIDVSMNFMYKDQNLSLY
ncbi:unnamed protein product [Ceutorhynchus assimilis]|uniref:THO complex subunit 6 n=1 Tax=Ceutorhynchus assimilis TaxID=467358 RepID=A0A9N9MNE5_9CUCU|nr:unnamed protein product [Ceutorhynchus assimilis]